MLVMLVKRIAAASGHQGSLRTKQWLNPQPHGFVCVFEEGRRHTMLVFRCQSLTTMMVWLTLGRGDIGSPYTD